jgi:hypothetical protein
MAFAAFTDLSAAAVRLGLTPIVFAGALGLLGGCGSLDTSNQTYVVPGTPSSCSGLVYYEVPAEACFTFGCTSGGKAYALCESSAYIACSCEVPCAPFEPAAGSSIPDAAPIACDASTRGDASRETGRREGGGPDGTVPETGPADAVRDVADASTKRDARHD